jgi:hypothetical protein
MSGNDSTLTFPVPGAAIRPSSPFSVGLTGAFPLSEGAGVSAFDAVFMRRSTFTAPGWQATSNGMAAKFNGTTSYISLAPFTTLLTSDVFTVMFWFQRIGSSTSWAFFGAQDGGAAGVVLDYGLHNAGKFSLVKNNVGQFTAVWTADSLLHHIAYVASGTSAWIYLDGNLLATGAITAGLLTSNVGALYLGARDETLSPTAFFSGTMNDLRIYNKRAFSAGEVQNVYQGRFNYLQAMPVRSRRYAVASAAPSRPKMGAALARPWTEEEN